MVKHLEKNYVPIVADIVFRAICIACVFAVKVELNYGGDADSGRFPVVAAVPTPISYFEPSVYTCFHPSYLFSTTYLINIFR